MQLFIYIYVYIYSVVAMFGVRAERRKQELQGGLVGGGDICAFSFFWGPSLRGDSRATLIYTLD